MSKLLNFTPLLDTLLVDKNGRFAENKLKGGDKDVIIKVSKKDVKNNTLRKNKDGSLKGSYRVSDGYEAGSIHTVSNSKGTAVVTTNEQAESVYDFLSDNTVVEFSHIEYKFNGGETQSSITTSHSWRADSYGTDMVNEIIDSELKTLVSYTHNHSSTFSGPYPSTKEHSIGNGGGDVTLFQKWTKEQGNVIKFYIKHNGVTREFDQYGNEIKP
ncbi:MAG: hypothetical protein OEW75_04105 [Cyclobacteriaceae bacterium]|nr:hypothetical protein [Cyclobacteriaceae bacterium]